jgi:diguanylate cyclase (GGDEF)-like protein/PAS domain S-box-containing protein
VDTFFHWLFDPAGLTPHGFCLLWRPGLLWTHALSDLITGGAYVGISLALAVIVRGRRDLLHPLLIWMFVTFILFCGLTHWFDVLTLWQPLYGMQGLVKVATAAVSVMTAVALWGLVPTIMTQPSLSQFRRVNESLRTNLDLLDRIATIAGVGGWDYDIANDRLTWSAETYRIHGAPADFQPTVENARNFYAPEARADIQATFEACLAERRGWDLEAPFDRADGRRIWVRIMGAPVFEDGALVRISGALQDVTELRSARFALQRESERAILAADSGGIGIWDWDLESDELHWDAWMYRLYGLDSRQAIGPVGAFMSRYLHADDAAGVEQALREALADRKAFEAEFRIVWDDGSIHHIRSTGHVTRDPAGRPIRMIGANLDISEPRRLAADLAQQHELLRVTLASIADGVITADVDCRVTWLNPAAEQMTGWTVDDAGSRAVSEVFQVVHEETRAPPRNLLEAGQSQAEMGVDADAMVLIPRGGGEVAIEATASPIRDARGERLGTVLVFSDVTERRRLVREMRHRASHDPLTGLVNRTEFDRRLSGALDKAWAGDGQGAICYIDFDQFKIVNDSCGHAVGDQLLIQAAGLLSASLRAGDTLARLGGDEFGVLLCDCSLAEAQGLAQDMCNRLEGFRFIHEEKRFRTGASIGLAPVDDRWSSAAAIQQAADAACYAAKEAGGGRVHTWHDTDEAMKVRRRQMQWATRLESALDEDRFILFHQLIDPLRAPRRGVTMEILLRMVDTDGSVVPPGVFLPAAERFQLASRIDRWVLSHVVRWMAETPLLGGIDAVNVNLSGQSLGDRSFHRWATDLLAAAGPTIRRKLCLEITETAVITNRADAAFFITQARDMGCRVALDDFGAGASSFGYLKSLPVDVIKIDGEFIRGLASDPLDAAAVRCFVDVARVLGLQTVAEFVETPEVLELLWRLGVDFVQGYLIHRPAPLSEYMAPTERHQIWAPIQAAAGTRSATSTA